MSFTFRGDFAKLQKCVFRTGFEGTWHKSGQTSSVHHALPGRSNWDPSTGNIWFEGKHGVELEQAFRVAAKARIKEVAESYNRRTLRRLSEQLAHVEEGCDDHFGKVEDQLERLEGWIRCLLDHVGAPGWREDNNNNA